MFRKGYYSFKLGDVEKDVDKVLKIRRDGKALLMKVVRDWNEFELLATMFPDGYRLLNRQGQKESVIWVDVNCTTCLPMFYDEETKIKTPFCIFEDCDDYSIGNGTFTCPDHEVSMRHFVEGMKLSNGMNDDIRKIFIA